MNRKTVVLLFILLNVGLLAHGRTRDSLDWGSIDITTPRAKTRIFPANYVEEIGKHDATLVAINMRLGGIDDKLTSIQGKLDNDVMPTIYVMNFFKWILGLMLGAIVVAWVNNWMRSKTSQVTH